MKLLARPRSPATEPMPTMVSGAPSRTVLEQREHPERRAGEIAVDQRARLCKVLLRGRLLAEHAVGDDDLVERAEARAQVVCGLLDPVHRGEIDRRTISALARAACLQVRRDGGEPVLAPRRKNEIAALRGAAPRVSLRDRRGRAQDQDPHAASAVTRRQKSDMMFGSRCASTLRQSG